jgi:hypothetical protein
MRVQDIYHMADKLGKVPLSGKPKMLGMLGIQVVLLQILKYINLQFQEKFDSLEYQGEVHYYMDQKAY